MMRGMPRFLRIVFSAAILFALAAPGCGKEEPAPAPVVKKPATQEAVRASEAEHPAFAPEAKARPASLYNPAGRRDPFIPFIEVTKKEAVPDLDSLPPLQRYELGELHFVGVIWGSGVARALVEDAVGKGYTVTVGTKIGRGGGVVTRITEDEIFVREAFRSHSGGRVERISSLKLKTGGEK